MSGAALFNNRGGFVKIKNQLLLTHGILVVLALAIVFINICTYKDMENDTSIINQVGKLRMLSYNMAHFSNQITTGNDLMDDVKAIRKNTTQKVTRWNGEEWNKSYNFIYDPKTNQTKNNHLQISYAIL